MPSEALEIVCDHRQVCGKGHCCALAATIAQVPAEACPVQLETCRACVALGITPTVDSPGWLAASVALTAAGRSPRGLELRKRFAPLFAARQPVPVPLPERPLLTVGMATYDDFHGVYFTLQSLHLHHAEVWPLLEIVLVDNHPASEHGKANAGLIEHLKHSGCRAAKYVPMTDATGTAAPRDRVFREATGDVVLCMDSHVLLVPGSLRGLVQFVQRYPDNRDLWHGPMLADGGNVYATHMEPVWRGRMFGIWGKDERGVQPSAEPFAIPMHGLGLFACRRDAWPGFHPGFRGFGGEEGYIHRKFELAGRQTLCLPWLRWLHRFGRPGGVPYPHFLQDTVRNYLLGAKELGLPTADIYRHFVQTGDIPVGTWRQLLAEVYGDDVPQEPVPPLIEEEGNRPQEFPAPHRLAWNLATAVARHWATGARQLADDEKAARLAVCRGCDLVKLNAAGEPSRCTKCGCYMAKKAEWASEDCPLGKWPALEQVAT